MYVPDNLSDKLLKGGASFNEDHLPLVSTYQPAPIYTSEDMYVPTDLDDKLLKGGANFAEHYDVGLTPTTGTSFKDMDLGILQSKEITRDVEKISCYSDPTLIPPLVHEQKPPIIYIPRESITPLSQTPPLDLNFPEKTFIPKLEPLTPLITTPESNAYNLLGDRGQNRLGIELPVLDLKPDRFSLPETEPILKLNRLDDPFKQNTSPITDFKNLLTPDIEDPLDKVREKFRLLLDKNY